MNLKSKHYAIGVGLLVSLGMHLQNASSWSEFLAIKSVGELLVQIATVVGALYVQPPAAAAEPKP